MNQIKRLLDINHSINYEVKKFRVSIEEEKSITCIENLSNELFCEIFDYLDGCDIFSAFSSLNIRFQNLLNDLSLLLKINISSQLIIQTHCKSIILPNKHRILSLNFSDESILDRFIIFCTISSTFQRLQSLILNSLPAYKFVVLLSDLISLPHLYSLTCSLTSCFVDVSYIYRIIFRFQYLQYFKLSLPIIEDLEDFEQVPFVADKQQLCNIEHLIIDHSSTLDDFVSIISCTPRLRRLTCQTLFSSDENIGKDVRLTLSNLTHIFIDRCELKFDVFEIFIKKICTQLQVFRIAIRCKDVLYLDANRWERLITQYMPCLRKFYFKYYEYFDDRLKLTSFHGLIDRFSSPFWIQRRWIFELELDANEIIYSISPHRKMWYERHNHIDNTICSFCQTTQFDVKYRCAVSWAESFSEYFNSIFAIMKITYLDIDCSRVPLLACVKLIRLLSQLNSLKLSSLSLTEVKRLSAEKSKIIHAVAYNNKITKVNLDKMTDFGEIQFLITLCPSMEYLEISSANTEDLELFVQFILTKRNNNYITCLSTLCLNVQNGTNEMVRDLDKMIELDKQLYNHVIKRIGNQIYLNWNVHTRENAQLHELIY